jgi:hypothetical protein
LFEFGDHEVVDAAGGMPFLKILAGAGSRRRDQLDRAVDRKAEHDRGGADDPGHLDLEVAVQRRGVGLVPRLLPPEGQRPAEVKQHADHHRRGHRGEHRVVRLLARRLLRRASWGQVRPPDQRDKQAADDARGDPEGEQPQAVPASARRDRGGGWAGGRRGAWRVGGHQACTSICPIM